MESQKYQEAFDEAKVWIDKLAALDPDTHLSCDINSDGLVRVNFFPKESVKLEATRLILSAAGKIVKDKECGTVTGTIGNVTIVLFYVLQCTITGYKTVRIPKVRVVEGEFEERQEPVYDCRLPEFREPEVPSAK